MNKYWIIVGIALVILGTVLFASSLSSSGWDFSKLSTQNLVTNSYDISRDFSAISVDTVTADVIIAPTDGDKCKVVCLEEEKAKHSVDVIDGVLTVKLIDERKWHDHIGINFSSPKITVYLPKKEYSDLSVKLITGDVDIDSRFTFDSVAISSATGDIRCRASSKGSMNITATTGDISLKGVTAGDIALALTSGDTLLTDVKCISLISAATTGDIDMKNVVADGKISIERSTGDIEFDRCDGGEIFIETTTGDVEGSFLSGKIFTVSSTTGDVRVPQSTSGGKCEIKVTTGDIEITVE